jgi:hypothetical protein
MPFSSRFFTKIDNLQFELDSLKLENSDLQAKLADAMAWLEITSNWIDRSKVDFDADGLVVNGRPATFLDDAKFQEAYRYGIDSGHRFSGDTPSDLHIEWRVAICLWAAWHAKNLPGDFVECGVNTGIFARAICKYIDFNASGKRFYLFDTYEGIPSEQAEPGFESDVAHSNALYYFDTWNLVQRNFAEFSNARPIRGRVPEILSTVEIDKVAYLSIDMNIPLPEIAALKHFWPKLVTGGIVVFDDYGFSKLQRDALDELTAQWGLKIWLLPTGQGILLKP